MNKENLQPKTPEAPVMEMARQVLGRVKEMDLTPDEKEKVMAMIDEAKGYESANQLSKALKKYQELLAYLKNKKTAEVIGKKLESELNLKEQYEEQVQTLKKVGILKKLKNGEWGMIDILGNEQPIPSYEEIKARMEVKVEMLDKKREQGFTQLLLVPIGMRLSEITEKAGELIVKKHGEGNLLATDGTTKLELEMKDGQPQPIYVDDIYQDADVKGDLVYGVKKFDKDNHGGRTKKELIEKTGGWQVMFIEDIPDLPKKGAGQEIEGRKQLEAGQSPEEYLAKIQTDEQYANEEFTTPEAQLAYFLYYLQKHNQVIDDFEGNGRICWNAGAFFKGAGLVPRGNWVRRGRQFSLDGISPDGHRDGVSARPSVII